jgi:hypothetical protein
MCLFWAFVCQATHLFYISERYADVRNRWVLCECGLVGSQAMKLLSLRRARPETVDFFIIGD